MAATTALVAGRAVGMPAEDQHVPLLLTAWLERVLLEFVRQLADRHCWWVIGQLLARIIPPDGRQGTTVCAGKIPVHPPRRRRKNGKKSPAAASAEGNGSDGSDRGSSILRIRRIGSFPNTGTGVDELNKIMFIF